MQLTQNREDKNLMGILLYYKSFLPCGIKHHWSGIEIKIEILRGNVSGCSLVVYRKLLYVL